jgi:hypothetical protein
MRRLSFTAALLFVCAAVSLAAQEVSVTPASTVGFSTGYVVANYDGVRVENGKTRGELKYTDDISIEDEELFGGLDGGFDINKPHELIAATAVLNIKEVVPADALKVYVEIAMEGAANSFLGVTGTTHSQVLERLRGKYNFTQKEISDAIKQTVAAAVDAEFNKLIFALDTNMKKTYTATLMRNSKTGQYTLSYELNTVENDDKEISAPTLDALLAEMQKNMTDFDEASIRSVSDNARFMPGIRLSSKAQENIKDIVASFYANPTSQVNFTTLVAVRMLYNNTRVEAIASRDGSFELFRNVVLAYDSTLEVLNKDLARKVYDNSNITRSATIPDLPRDQQETFTQTVSARGN